MSEDTALPPPMEPIPQPRTTILKIAVVVMSVLLVAGFALVVVTIVKRVSNPDAAAAKALAAGRFGVSEVRIAPGETVKSFTMTEDRIAIHMAGNAGEQIILVNAKTGQELGRIHLRPVTDFASRERD